MIKKIMVLTVITLAFGVSELEAQSSYRTNDYNYGINGSSSLTGTSSNYGGSTTYHRFNNGTTGTSSNYGGSTTYHRLNNGTTGTSSNYGGSTTYHRFSNNRRGY